MSFVLQIEVLKGFEGPREKLGAAEQFMSQLIELPGYRLRLEALLLRLEYSLTSGQLMAGIQALGAACPAILNSASLKEFLRFALHTGNFINAVSVSHTMMV